jgi:N-acetylglucosaminyldiphosphoundecaprenol N-acetyl-beta-D-mannosaminyltransferase
MTPLQSRRRHRSAPLDATCAHTSRPVLGVGFDLVSYEDVLQAIENWRAKGQRHYVTLTPPYSVVMCCRDNELKEATQSATLTLPDGVGIILAALLLGYPHHGRVSGPTLLLKLCDWGRAQGLRHFFYGGAPGVADALVLRLSARFPGLTIAGTSCPPFRPLTPEEDRELVQRINETKPDVVWVGLGSPKQEKWMASHVDRIEAAALIGIGAAFDFHSGRVNWAPAWMRKMGMEWAYRLAHEPKRMWRRNVNSFVFLARVLHQRVMSVGGSASSRVHHEAT